MRERELFPFSSLVLLGDKSRVVLLLEELSFRVGVATGSSTQELDSK